MADIFQAAVSMVVTVVQAAVRHGRHQQAAQVTHPALLQLKVLTAHLVKVVAQQAVAAVLLLHRLQPLVVLVIHHFPVGLQLLQLEVLDHIQQVAQVAQVVAELLVQQQAATAVVAAGTYPAELAELVL